MATPLMELYATLGLDATDFQEEAASLVEDSGEIAEDVSEAFASADTAASSVKSDLDDLQEKSSATQSIMEGFASAAGSVVEDVIEGIIEFGKKSIEVAASSGSALAKEYNDAKKDFDNFTLHMQQGVGEALLSILTTLMNAVSGGGGIIDDMSDIDAGLAAIDAYAFDNLQRVKADLTAIFGMFEEVQAVQPAEETAQDMTSALQSQADYWTDYYKTLENLKKRGIDPEFLNEIANGTAESLATMKSLESADTEEFDALMDTYKAVEEARTNAATSLNETRLAMDEDFQALITSFNEMVGGMDQSSQLHANTVISLISISKAFQEQYPGFASWVDAYLEKFSQLGTMSVPQASSEWQGSPLPPQHASGLGYVPYDGYNAILHRGETVLTRQQAEEYRGAGGAVSAAIDASALADAVRGALNGAVVQMDGHAVGTLLTETVSRSIAQTARRERRYG